MLTFERLSQAHKDSLLQLGRNVKGLDSLITVISEDLADATRNYESAKEALVASGNNRELCLTLRARVATLTEIGNLLESLRKI